MSLRDLKNLAPWQWESKTAQKKHAIGPKGLQDFEQIARVLQNDASAPGGGDLKEKQAQSVKRRRGPKEADEVAGSAADPGHGGAGGADAALAAPTPSMSAKKHRPTASELLQKANRHHSPPAPPGSCTPAGTGAAAARRGTPAAAAYKDSSSSGGHCPSAAKVAPTPSTARTPAAPTAAGLLADAFSPCPVPTPTPCATLRFKQGSAEGSGSAGTKPSAPGSVSATKPRSGSGLRSSSNSRPRGAAFGAAAAAFTPLPRPQFTPRMPPPANMRSGNGGSCLQQTPLAPAAAAAAAAAGSSSALKKSPPVVQTPLGASTFGLGSSLSHLQALLAHADAEACSPEGPQQQGSEDASLNPRADQGVLNPGSFSLMSPREAQALGGLGFKTSSGTWGGMGSTHSPPAPTLLATPGVAAAAPGAAAAAAAGFGCSAAAGERAVNAIGEHGAGAAARLPAKLRCKKEASRSGSGEWAATNSPQGANNNNSSSNTSTPCPGSANAEGAAAGHSPLMGGCSLADLADAAAAQGAEQQQKQQQAEIGFAGPEDRPSSSARAEQQTPQVPDSRRRSDSSAQIGTCAGSAVSEEGRAAFVTPAGRMGLKRLWCHTHAAAIAAEAAADAARDAAANTAGAVSCSPPQAGVSPEASGPDSSRSRSPDSLAVAMSAELLLAAAQLDDPVPAEQSLGAPAAAAAYDAAAAVTDMAIDGEHDQDQQQQMLPLFAPAAPMALDEPVDMHVDETAAAVPVAPEVKHSKQRRSHSHQSGEPPASKQRQQRQQQARTAHHSVERSEAVAVQGSCTPGYATVNLAAEGHAAAASSCGNSLMLPPAAQLRLLQQQMAGSGGNAAAAGNVAGSAGGTGGSSSSSPGECGATAPATAAQPTWALVPTSAGVVASAGLGSSAAGGMQCLPYVLLNTASLTAAGQGSSGLQQQQQQPVSLPLTLQHLNLQQQLAAVGYSASYGLFAGNSGSSSAALNSSNSVRTPHVPPSVHAAQCNMTRTSHTGVLLQSAHPGMQAQGPAGLQMQAAAAWNTRLVLLQQQQQHGLLLGDVSDVAAAAAAQQAGLGGGGAAGVKRGHRQARRGRTPEPATGPDCSIGQQQQELAAGSKGCVNGVAAGMKKAGSSKAAATSSSHHSANKPPAHPAPASLCAAAAAAGSRPANMASSSISLSAGSSSCAVAAAKVGLQQAQPELLPAIEPLKVPSTMSDEEAWRLAQSQPWVIAAEAARAQQLLANVTAATTAAAAGSSAATGPLVGAGGAGGGGGRIAGKPNDGGVSAAGRAAVEAAGHYGVQGVMAAGVRQQQQVAKPMQQQKPTGARVGASGGGFGGVLCAIDHNIFV